MFLKKLNKTPSKKKKKKDIPYKNVDF